MSSLPKTDMLVKIEIEVTSDGITHNKLTCGEKRTFAEVLRGLEVCRDEIERTIANRSLCPFSSK